MNNRLLRGTYASYDRFRLIDTKMSCYPDRQVEPLFHMHMRTGMVGTTPRATQGDEKGHVMGQFFQGKHDNVC